jgi:hypothetical protein
LNRAPGESTACSAPGGRDRLDKSDAGLGLLFNLDVHGMQPRAAGLPHISMAKKEDGLVFSHVPRSARNIAEGHATMPFVMTNENRDSYDMVDCQV